MSGKRIVYIHQRVFAHYRMPIFRRLARSDKYKFIFIADHSQAESTQGIPLESIPFLTVKNIYFPLPFLKHKLYWQKGLMRIVCFHRFSALITGADPYNITSWFLPFICQIRHIPLILWSIGVLQEERGLKKWLRYVFLSGYDMLLLYGNKARKTLIKQGIHPDKLLVIYNSVATKEIFDFKESKLDHLRHKFQIGPQTRVLIHLGSLAPRKKITFLLDAVKKLVDEGKSVHLFFIGEGEERAALESRVDALHLNDIVTFTGQILDQEELSLFLHLGDVTVLPGNAGLAIIHSLAYGIPVVIHDNASHTQGPEGEAVVDGVTGVIYKEGDCDDLVAKIKFLLYPTPQKCFMSAHCRTIVQRYYTPQYQESIIYQALEQVFFTRTDSPIFRSPTKGNNSFCVGFPHPPPAFGGPGTFQENISVFLEQSGFKISYPGEKNKPDVIFIVGGTAKILWILFHKCMGAKVIHRVDGINWKHRVFSVSPGKSLISSARNALVRFIRRYLADYVIYQSNFVKAFWEERYGTVAVPQSVIYNGCNTNRFLSGKRTNRILLCVEGTIPSESVYCLESISRRLLQEQVIDHVLVCGNISAADKRRLQGVEGIIVLGLVNRGKMPDIFAQASLFLSLEINPPCPNAVLEALSAGLPVVGFDTGSLAELVPADAGCLVSYRGNPWKLIVQDTKELEEAALYVLDHLAEYSMQARTAAVAQFSLERMNREYLDVISSLVGCSS